jgi:glycosyltransferase involved in cell wall biosynthesis
MEATPGVTEVRPVVPPEPRVGLVMIVKDEEAVIERALRSARPFINTWTIVDTGSTDKTKEIIHRVMGDMPGLLAERPWVNFGHNRSEALKLAEDHMDWAIMMDADDTMEGTVPPAHVWKLPNIDGMTMTLQHGQMRHRRIQVMRLAAGWSYKGVLHEIATCKLEKPRIEMLPEETYMITRCEGVRSRNPNKYKDDADVLLKEWESGNKTPRTLFYMAQSYRDANMKPEAIARYSEYMDISGATVHEKYLALLSLSTLVDDPVERTKIAWQGIELVPSRLEVPYTYMTRWRQEGLKMGLQQFAIASILPTRKPNPNDIYINPLIYDWGMDNELMGVAAEVGRWNIARDTAMRCAIYMPTAEMREASVQRVKMANQLLG